MYVYIQACNKCIYIDREEWHLSLVFQEVILLSLCGSILLLYITRLVFALKIKHIWTILPRFPFQMRQKYSTQS